MFTRYLTAQIPKHLKNGRVLIIYGPRRVGKTFLLNQILESYDGKTYSGVGEDRALRDTLESESVERIMNAFTGYDLIALDEAQKVADIGTGLKILVDHVQKSAVIATGSSSFDLANQVGEPLTGRKRTLVLYPLSALELKDQFGPMRVEEMIEELLIFGAYPETLDAQNREDRILYLNELRDSYLYKDVLELESVRNSRKLMDLLTLLAFQIGRDVSVSELATSLSLGQPTVLRYLDLLEKAFVIKSLRGFSRNLRKEVTKMARYYFLDNGVRNAVISNFNPLSRRDDAGQLWENFLFIERIKKQHYTGVVCNTYFWRTYDRQEIDLIEERDGRLFAYEFKYATRKKVGAPKAWLKSYPQAEFEVITRKNFLPFIT